MIDWHRVKTLREEVGDDDFLKVAVMFLEESDEVVEALKTTPKEFEFEELFHSLKGSALNLGFQRLAAICAKEENRAAQKDFGEIDVSVVVEVYAVSKRQFRSQIDDLAA